MSSPANDEARQEALRDGLQHGARKHVDPQLGPPEMVFKVCKVVINFLTKANDRRSYRVT